MNLQQASNLGTVDDVANMLNLQFAAFYFLIPLITLCIFAFAFRWRKIKRKQKKEEKERQRKLKEQQEKQIKHQKEMQKKKVDSIFGSTEKMMQQLDDISEPLVKSDYNNLTINFDKNGKMIKENKHG